MNVLFLTIDHVTSFSDRSIYIDLVNQFIEKGCYVTVLSACEQREQRRNSSVYFEVDGGEVIKVLVPNVTKVENYIQKGISLVRFNYLFQKAAVKAMKKRKYDLVLYGSPPVTVYGAVELVKKRQGAYSYLLLKDIWPYDCVFGNVLTTHGWKGIAFYILKLMARRLYRASDYIGCMSPANIRFLLDNEPWLSKKKIEINPNSVKPFGWALTDEKREAMSIQNGLPCDKVIFIYGGNLGIAQGIDFALKAVKASETVEEACFVFVGGGTAKAKVKKAENSSDFKNLIFLPAMPKDDYEQLVYACDVGLIFLNHECLAPNYPSRLLSYMQAALPVICATDTYTDVGKIGVENGYGLWCESNQTDDFVKCVRKLCEKSLRSSMGREAHSYFVNHYTVQTSYELIVRHFQENN